MKTEAKTEMETLFADLDKPSLHALSYALRHPDTWPKNFYWDYGDCDQCAMGLAHELWSIQQPDGWSDYRIGVTHMARLFAMGYSDAEAIFYNANVSRPYTEEEIIKTGIFGWGKPIVRKIMMTPGRDEITPEMIADDIDKYLASRE